LEENHKLERAFEVYEEALERLPERWDGLSGKEKLRAVGIAYKLGEMAGAMTGKEEKEEGYLAWAVESLLKSVKDDSERKTREGFESRSENSNDALQLPEWATNIDIAAPFEALGSYYARTGKLEYVPANLMLNFFLLISGDNFRYAMALYLQAISVLIPPPPQSSSVEDRCRGP
jgi:tetratricopeptide (TPR) repeat protein